jgi:hypothetical protein
MAILTRPHGGATRKDTGPGEPTNHVVNLLPAETVERQQARLLVRRFVLAAVGLVVLGAGLWLAQASAINSAQEQLASSQSDLTDAQARLEPLAPVKAFSASLDQQQQLVGTSMAMHTSFSRVLQSFSAAWPAKSDLRTLDAVLGTGCAGPDTFEPAPSIGCVTWTVSVPGQAQVRQLTAALAHQRGLVSPFLTGAVRSDETGRYDASGTVNFDVRLLTNRFKNLLEEVAQ